MIIKQESNIIYNHYIPDLQIYGFNFCKSNKIKKKIHFYDILEDYKYEENDIKTYVNFVYSILLNYNKYENIEKDIMNYEKNFSWESIFKCLCTENKIDDLIKTITKKEVIDTKRKEYLKIICLSISNYVKKTEFNDFSLWMNFPIIYMTRKALIPIELLYISTTGLKICPKIPSLETYINNKKCTTLIGINNDTYRIFEWRADISKLLIRPIVLSTHTIYVMCNVVDFDKKYNLFKDMQSLLIVYYYLLKTDKDINIAKTIGLIKDKGITSNILLKFLYEFACQYNFQIEKLHGLRIDYEMVYPNYFYGPYYYNKNEYKLIKNE